jgi:hypothetical protein
MADPYLLVTHWARPVPSYNKLARSLIPKLDGLGLSVHLTDETQTRFFDDIGPASKWLENDSEVLITRFVIDFPAGVSLATTDWGRSETMIELSLGSADSDSMPVSGAGKDIFAKIQTLVCVLVSGAGARFVWLTHVPGDVEGLDDAISAFDAVLSDTSSRPLPLDKMSHSGWLFAWPLGLAGRTIQTSEKVISAGNCQYVELVKDRPIDLVSGWVKMAR